MIRQRIVAAGGLAAILMFVSAAAMADIKLAVIRSADVVRESQIYKSAEAKMKTEFDKRKSDLESQGKQFQSDVEKYQRDRDTLSPDQRAKTEKDLNARQIDLQAAQRKFQDDLQNRDREFTQDLMNKIKDVIFQIAKEKGYDVVIQDPVFNTPSVDITDEVLQRLNASAGAPAKK